MTDSSRLRAGSDGLLLNLDCQSCGKNFDLDMVTGRTVHGRGRRESPALALPPPVETKIGHTPSRGTSPKKDNWTHGGEGVASKAVDENWAFEPLLPDAPVELPGVRLPIPIHTSEPKGFQPLLPESESTKKPEPTATEKSKTIETPRCNPEPPPPEEPPVMSTAHQPKAGFWKKFSSMPLWQQWSIIVIVVALIGTAIFLSPLGESKPVEVKQ